ncbi:octopamine receptor Oamb isoform X1 [Lucilia sericata]|uniref:octopamine receptor Oamb isoform X1 n=1 Tax=Lucilia sericata TaxID=13632 RepID=UPI0018A841CB|nr:octopamine receptor Oamb isoform X1 [Lucilia sericata]
MNETECDNLIKSVKWTEPSNLISLAILEFINVLVIGGNLLVIAAVFCSNKLRSVTNFFIVNLAVADLLVGLAVLPFSATWEVFKVWIFGDVWCRIWLAVDVWMCTASILNLCAISLDRYVAVTRPVTYPSIMSTKKAKSLIAGIWVLSFVICFPPLVGWKDQKPMLQPTYTRGNYTLYYATSATTISSESSSTTTTSSSLIGVVAPTSTSPSLKHKGKRQRKFLKTTTNAPYTIHSSPATAPVSIAKALRHTRRTSAKSSSSSLYTSSSLYNSFNPYDPYYAHLQNHNTGDKNVNNRVAAVDDDDNSPAGINDNNSNYNYHYSNENADADNSKVAGADDTSATDLVDDDEYTLTTSDSSESSSIRYNNDPTSAMYYDTADSGRVMMNGAETLPTTTTYTSSPSSMSSYAAPPPPCPWKCELTNDRGYVLYSALGSFYIPMFVMLFFYWRIYRAAVRTTRAINQGFKTTKGSPHESRTNRVDETQLVLRIHRGRPCSTPQRTPLSVHSMSSTLSVNSNNEEMYPLQHHHASVPHQLSATPKRATSMRVPRTKHEKVSIKVSFPSSENMLDSTTSINSTPPAYASVVSSTATNTQQSASTSLINGRRSSFKSSLFEIGETTFNVDNNEHVDTNTPSHSNKLMESHTDSLLKKSDKKHRGKRSVKFQVKRFKVETKAAKTLAIIVGGFIFCWLPFFTMYLIRAFCDHCIQPTVFSVLFWLGYCNSAINPLIYALFSHEFRIAFKRIVCRCVCTRSGFRASENFQMIAARALMAPATFHKTISGCSDEGDGPDFS